MRALENRIPPPALMVIIAAVMAISSRVLEASPVPLMARLMVSLPLFLAAGLFGFPAIAAFRQAGTSINPVQISRASTLVTSGIFGITRNPMYVALALLLSTLAVGLGHLAMVVGPLAFVAFTSRFQIVPEERTLLRRFGTEYESYRSSVHRWLW